MIDSGSTGCTLSEPAVKHLLQHDPDLRRYSAAEDLSQPDHIQVHSQSVTDAVKPRSEEDVRRVLDKLGLSDLDLDSCAVSDIWRDRLLQIIERHESIFSRHKMDSGEASDCVHKIHLVDERPFWLPYRRVPPSHYEKLRTALNEMEERGIISQISQRVRITPRPCVEEKW
ncbi:hypothetical protein L3Q82_023712 [Scortum barcoo]|uniref:Uncharacterized protein n=1 Tax=Scortum barcoo TaxID=214431 RepID=A0ACB8WUU0_9TELE|nr:hypothetical protein L3Q82_023712 [Scortum barcoo]